MTKFAAAFFLAVLIYAGGCASGIRVQENTPGERRDYGVTDYSAGKLSSGTLNLLGNFLLTELYQKDPTAALLRLQQLWNSEKRPEYIIALADAALQAGYRFSSDPDRSSRYFLASAVYSMAFLKYLDDEKDLYCENRFRLIRICNQAVTELFFYLKARKLEQRSGFAIPMLEDSNGRQVRFNDPVYDLPLSADNIARFTPCANYRTLGLTHDTRVFGLGVPLVAELKAGCRDVGGKLIDGLPVAVTFVLDIEEKNGTINVTPRYIYSRVREKVTLGKRVFPLAADFSVPLACAAGAPQHMNFIARTIRVAEANSFTGLYHFEPYDEKRIPVIFVHGLMSDARTWGQMLNTLFSDPVLRRQYQFLGFAYSSGAPIFVSAARLRKELKELREALVRQQRSTAQFDKMVLVGHSMGGLLSRLQITECQEQLLAKELNIKNFENIKKRLNSKHKKYFSSLLNFTPAPFVKRVIFIAVPHRGSQVATSWIGRMGAALIRLPAELVYRNIQLISELVSKGKLVLNAGSYGTGIDNLRPDDTMLQLLNKLKFAPGIPFHSIIGNRSAAGIPGGSDGIVPYSSSHLDGAVSELVVQSGHSVQRNALAIQEVRRILLLHISKNMKGQIK
ncbi:MAG: hypothetical protein E7048_04020 [Lentisphaerae bacterium]|nr:hypothetical protein [Lentisphaerota bacterium]